MKEAIDHLRQCDPVLAAIIDRVGAYNLQHREATFDTMVRSIVFQQLNGKAARTIFERVREACRQAANKSAAANRASKTNGSSSRPQTATASEFAITPESVLALTPRKMRACGLSRQKLSYIRDLAKRTATGEIEFDRLADMSDEQVVEHLTRVKGIGTWSAQMFLMFALRRPNILPTLDYGVRVAIKKHYRKRKLPDHKTVVKIGKSWQPYSSVACW